MMQEDDSSDYEADKAGQTKLYISPHILPSYTSSPSPSTPRLQPPQIPDDPLDHDHDDDSDSLSPPSAHPLPSPSHPSVVHEVVSSSSAPVVAEERKSLETKSAATRSMRLLSVGGMPRSECIRMHLSDFSNFPGCSYRKKDTSKEETYILEYQSVDHPEKKVFSLSYPVDFLIDPFSFPSIFVLDPYNLSEIQQLTLPDSDLLKLQTGVFPTLLLIKDTTRSSLSISDDDGARVPAFRVTYEPRGFVARLKRKLGLSKPHGGDDMARDIEMVSLDHMGSSPNADQHLLSADPSAFQSIFNKKGDKRLSSHIAKVVLGSIIAGCILGLILLFLILIF
jgi:hypothetical protein